MLIAKTSAKFSLKKTPAGSVPATATWMLLTAMVTLPAIRSIWIVIFWTPVATPEEKTNEWKTGAANFADWVATQSTYWLAARVLTVNGVDGPVPLLLPRPKRLTPPGICPLANPSTAHSTVSCRVSK